MYLHIGGDMSVSLKEIIGIFDIDNTTRSRETRNFLKIAEVKKMIITISNEIPKSFVVVNKNKRVIVYLSPISTSTLLKRGSEL